MFDLKFSSVEDNNTYLSTIEVHNTPYYTRDKIFEGCIKNIQSPDQYPSPSLGDLIAIFEEQMLSDLEDDIGTNIRIQKMFETLMKQLKVNFYVFVGHINMCEDFVKRIDEKIIPDRINSMNHPFVSWPFNSSPVIVLFIACLGKEQAEIANHKDTWQKNKFVAMGFNDLVHIYEGEIYGCKIPHRNLPNMTCHYDGAEEDYKKLMDAIGNNPDDFHLAQQENNPLVSCCESKYNRFREQFLNNLRKRNCAKFTTEKIAEKIRGLLNDDGSLKEDIANNTSSFLFSYEDGIPCDDQAQCDISNPYDGATKVADSFNARSSILKLFTEFETLASVERPRNEKDEQILKRLQNLRPEEKKIFQYRKENKTLCHIFGKYGLLKSIQYIIKKEIPNFSLQSSINGDTILHSILRSPYIQDVSEIMPFVYKAFQADPNCLGIRNQSNDDILSLAVKYQYYPIVEFIAVKTSFDFAMNNYGDGSRNLLFLSFEFFPWYSEQSYKMVKLLLSKGANPNDNSNYGDIMVEIMDLWTPPFNAKIFKELCYYGYSKKKDLQYVIQFYTDRLTNPVQEIPYKQTIQDNFDKVEKMLEDPRVIGIEKIMYENEQKIIELLLLDFKGQMRQTIQMLKDCLEIVNKGGKKNTQILARSEKTRKNVFANINAYNIRYQATEHISDLNKQIDEFIKTVGAQFSADEKKAYRARLRSFLTDQSRNIVDRYQDMRNLLEEIEDEAYSRGYYQNVSSNNGRSINSYGGRRRYRKTRKNLKKRKTLRKVKH